MANSALKDSQLQMARYLRDPQGRQPPPGVEQRRLKVYRDLVYNNIEGFISGGFPVLRSLYADPDWHGLVRSFIDGHRARSPYFLEISQEFLAYLMEGHDLRECDPPFMAELAHYEWVELALDVSGEELTESEPVADCAAAVPALSPLAWVLAYSFPVHRIGPGFMPAEADQPTYLVVYRNRQDRVRFMELNATTARLLELVRDNEGASVAELLATLAAEIGMPVESVVDFGVEQIELLAAEAIVFLAGR